MKKYTLCLVAMLLLPFAALAQTDVLKKMVAACNEPPEQSFEKQAPKFSQEEVKASLVEMNEYARQQAQGTGWEATDFEGTVSRYREVTIDSSLKLTEGTFPTQTAPRKLPRKVAAKLVLGGYFAKDTSTNGSTYLSNMTLFQDADGTYKMARVYSQADSVALTVDLSAGTVKIAAQKMFTNSTYGDVWMVPLFYNAGTGSYSYSKTKAIEGTIDENGLITLPAWGIVVLDEGSKYNQRAINLFTGSQWAAHNAEITRVVLESTNAGTDTVSVTEDALIEQISENEIRIYNLAGTSAAVNATITPQKVIKISPQSVLSTALYGAFYCYPAEITTKLKIYMDEPIVATMDAGSINIGNWVVCQRNSITGVLYKFLSTKITTSFNIAWPKAVDVKYQGEGTEASPYLISSAADINMLAQAVNGGENYLGKYFKQTQNISLASITSSYQPVGDATSHFAGTYDGAGFTVSDLTLYARGFSNIGLFGYVDSLGTVKNVSVKNFKVTSYGSNVAFVVGSNYGTVENCTVSASVISSQTDNLGAVVGNNMGTVKGCSSDASTSISNTGNTGGVVGSNQGAIENSNSSAKISITGYYGSLYHSAGGVVGYSAYYKTSRGKITDCWFAGTITDAVSTTSGSTYGYSRAGGIVGSALNADISRSFNAGLIYQGDDGVTTVAAAGLAGMCSGSTITDCYNGGSITKIGTSKNVGGLVGYLSLSYIYSSTGYRPSDLSTVTNCYNSGLVYSSTLHSGSGIYGDAFRVTGIEPISLTFFNCFSDIQITGLDEGTFNKPTSFFTSGTLPEGFSSDLWTATSGYYPVLKEFAATTAAKVSSSSIALAGGETRMNVKKTFTLNAPDGINWGLSAADGSGYVTSNDALSISGNTVSIKNQYSNEIVLAYTPDKTMQKMYLLAIVPKVFDGEGTETSPFLVKSAADFEKLYSAVTEHHQPHAGDFFKMTNDIDFTGSSFIGVNGRQTYFFSGTFDGDNHYIHNLNINSVGYDDNGNVSSKASYVYSGLFGVCSVKSTIKNVRMAADNKFEFYSYSAPIVGITLGKVINCRNYADVSGASSYVAGVVGVTDTTAVISGCYNAGHIKVGSSQAAGIVAGLSKYATVELSQNDGTIEALLLENSTAKDSIQNTVGGIAAYNYGTVDRCVNTGTVSAYKQMGGIVGYNSTTGGYGIIKNCVNTGLVVSRLDDNALRGAIMANSAKNIFTNNYYDASVCTYGAANNTTLNGSVGLSSVELTSGKALSGMNAEEWSFKANAYPVLKAFEDEAATKALRNMYIAFGDGEVVSNVIKNVNLSADTNIKWALKQGKNFTVAGTVLNVTVPTDMNVAYDTLTATYGETKLQKTYYLSSVPIIFDGSGTLASPFQIKSKADMDKLANFIEQTGMDYSGYYFKVMNDIDYAGDTLSLIASGARTFKGDFDGNGKTIKGYVYENTTVKEGKYLSPFVNLGSTGVIHDLTLDGNITGHSYLGGFVYKLYGTLRNCTFKGSVNASMNSYAAGLACYAYEGSLMENCVNAGNVSVKTSYAGGLACYMYKGSRATGCTNKGTVTVPTSYCGGIVAYLYGVLDNCVNEGTLNGKGTVGGITAYVYGTDTIKNCRNIVDITATGSTLGGIVASAYLNSASYITDCYNTGNLTATGVIGGVIASGGTATQYTATTVVNCYNIGNIKATGTGGSIGGIVGKISGTEESTSHAASVCQINDCYNTGNITAGGGTAIGGICGYLYKNSHVADCYNLGTIDITKNKENYGVGGVCGSTYGSIKNSWSAGDVTSVYSGVGGVSGLGTGSADGCANFGNISAGSTSNKYAGGIWGYQTPATMSNCYNMGSITSPKAASGIDGMPNANFNAQNCYNAGKLTITGTDKSKCSNMGYFSSTNAMKSAVVKNVYYDLSLNPESLPQDTLGFAVPLLTQQMFSAELGDAYEYNKAAYPTNLSFKERSVPNFYASNIEYIEQGDTATSVTGKFYYAALAGVTVTSSDNITLNAGEATPTALGEGWIKYETELHGKKFEKTFNVTIVKATGIDSLTDGGKEVLSREYYDINGVRYETPSAGKLYIMKSVYSDGTSAVKKIYVK